MEKNENILNEFIPQLKTFVQSEMVFGKPYELGEITLIPVNTVRVGFGFGEGRGKKDKHESNSGGGGAGGGVMVNPVAFILIKGDSVTLHNITSGSIENVLDKIPDFLEKLIDLSKKIMKEKKDE